MKPSSIRNLGSIRCRVLESSSSCRNLVGIVAHVAVYVATLNVLDFNEPVNKLPVCTPERRLKHHVNLTINNDNLNYGGPQLSHQNQMHTANDKSLTANSNRTQQIQIAHSKFKSLTANYKSLNANYKSLNANYKSPTANSNRPQQIQIAHSKLNSLTANSRVCLFVEGRGSFFECRRYIVEGPYVTLKNVWKSVKRIYIKFAHPVFYILVSLFLSMYSVVTQRSSVARLRLSLRGSIYCTS